MKRLLFAFGLCLAITACGGTATTTAATAGNAPAGASAQQQVNAIRASAGRSKITRSAKLDRIALGHAKDMAANKFMGHTGSDGSDLTKRADRGGYKWCTLAENVSRGYTSETVTIQKWSASAGHYRNMIKPKVKEFGLAIVNGYGVMVLSARNC